MNDDLVKVTLLGIPIAIHQHTTEHRDALDREFALALADDPNSLSTRLLRLSEQLRTSLQAMGDLFDETLNAAIARGDTRFDIELLVPAEAADAIEEIDGLLDEADAASARGELLTLAASPVAVAYRRWFVRELVEQIREGRAPRRWRGEDVEEESMPDQTPGDDFTVFVRDDLDFTTAAKLRAELTDLIDSGVGEVVLDLSGCGFVDSVGVGLLVSTHQRCEAEGGRLRLRGVTDNVGRTLDLASLLEVLHVG